jgi:hypothetical protein
MRGRGRSIGFALLAAAGLVVFLGLASPCGSAVSPTCDLSSRARILVAYLARAERAIPLPGSRS